MFVIGEKDTVLGFSLVGVEGTATDSASTASAKLDDVLQDPEVGLILITASIARSIRPMIEEQESVTALPLILEIPDRLNRPEKAPLGALVRRATGSTL